MSPAVSRAPNPLIMRPGKTVSWSINSSAHSHQCHLQFFFFFFTDNSVMVLEDIEEAEGGKQEMEGEIIIDVTGTAVRPGTKGNKCSS